MAESVSMPGLTGRVSVLAIRRGDERFACLRGLRLEDIEKVWHISLIKIFVIKI